MRASRIKRRDSTEIAVKFGNAPLREQRVKTKKNRRLKLYSIPENRVLRYERVSYLPARCFGSWGIAAPKAARASRTTAHLIVIQCCCRIPSVGPVQSFIPKSISNKDIIGDLPADLPSLQDFAVCARYPLLFRMDH